VAAVAADQPLVVLLAQGAEVLVALAAEATVLLILVEVQAAAGVLAAALVVLDLLYCVIQAA
jgi:hypothetical protein